MLDSKQRFLVHEIHTGRSFAIAYRSPVNFEIFGKQPTGLELGRNLDRFRETKGARNKR